MIILENTLDTLIPSLVDIVEKAGKLISDIYNDEFEVIKKEDGSPVTKADTLSHDLLKAELERLTPGVPVISEEDESSWIVKSPQYWLVDPLDGTKGFIYKTGDFCINIALMENDKPIFGLIHLPLTRETYYGFNGKAFRNLAGDLSPIHTRHFPANGLTLLLGGYGKKFKEQEDFFLKTYPITKIMRLRSAIKFCLIASGSADIYMRFEPCYEWDTAAGHALLEAAGGILTQVNGSPFLYGKTHLINEAFVAFGQKP